MKSVTYTKRCKECGNETTGSVPKDILKIFKECGVSNGIAGRIYYDNVMKNSWFSSFGIVVCDLCRKKRVLVWCDGCSPSGTYTVSPNSAEINFWPQYDYPDAKIYVCSFCKPRNDDEKSRTEYIRHLNSAITRKNKEIMKHKYKMEVRKA